MFTKNAKSKQALTESLFTSGGMLEVMNQKNSNVVLNIDSFVYLSSSQATLLRQKQQAEFHEVVLGLLPLGAEVCFRVTEPCLQTFVPKVSEPKLGKITHVDLLSLPGDAVLSIELREDFRLPDPEADEQLMMAFPDNKYEGEGRYRLSLGDIQGLYIRVEDPERQQTLLKTLKEPAAAPKQATASFLESQQENIEKAIRRQIEYYFSDTNFPKDKYLQKKCGEHPEGYIHLKDVMSFNKMRKLTKTPEQVVAALEGSTVVEFSEDGKFIRKRA